MPKKPHALNPIEVQRIRDFTIPYTDLGVSINLMLYCGLRVNEVSQVTRSDIKHSLWTGMFTVRKEIAKYHKPRSIPVCPALAESLGFWYSKHDTLRYRHLRLWTKSKRTVQRHFSQFMEEIKVKCTPHDLRHTFACALYAQTNDLSLIQAALGHVKLTTTLIYCNIDGYLQDQISKAYENYPGSPSRKTYRDIFD